MSSFEIELKEPIIHNRKIHLSYTRSIGPVSTKFLRALGEKKILGMRCAACNRVYVPPQAVCPGCFAQLDEWVELDGRGTVSTYTIVNYSLPIQPVPPPFILGVIKLDGADTGFVHFLGEVNFDDVKIGMKVKPVFKEKPECNILDIKYFKPI